MTCADEVFGKCNVRRERRCLLEAVVGTDGDVITPMGAPNAVLFRARSAGRAAIDVVVGDPWQSPGTLHLTVVVAPT